MYADGQADIESGQPVQPVFVENLKIALVLVINIHKYPKIIGTRLYQSRIIPLNKRDYIIFIGLIYICGKFTDMADTINNRAVL